MKVKFLDKEERGNPLNGRLIDSSQELERILDQLRHRMPFGLELAGENGLSLDICLAETHGAVEYKPSNGDPPYMEAVAPGSPACVPRNERNPYEAAVNEDIQKGLKSHEFLVGGTATPVPTRYILPYAMVKKIAVHFLETGGREPDVLWEEI